MEASAPTTVRTSEMVHSLSAHSRRSQRALLVAIGVATVLGVGALALLWSGPWNGETRSELGSAIITALIVGLALVIIERRVDQQREDRERAAREGLFSVAARDAFARLLVVYVESCWSFLEPYLDDSAFLVKQPDVLTGGDVAQDIDEYIDVADFIGEAPTGFVEGDTRKVWAALAWFIERSSNKASWWKDKTLSIRVDAFISVSIDLLNRKGFPQDQGEQWSAEEDSRFRSLATTTQWTLDWLANLVQRLLELDDAEHAFALDSLVRALQFGETPTYGAGGRYEVISPWRDRRGVERLGLPYPLSNIRQVAGWLVDRLRDDAILVDRWGEPTVKAPAPVIYRWGSLLGKDDDATSWDCRFGQGSWFRHTLDAAAQEWREIVMKDLNIPRGG